MTQPPLDVVVLGAGPAGLALAASAAATGLRVACVDPRPMARWIPTYACWLDDLEGTPFTDTFRATWASPMVRLGMQDDVEHLALQRRYGLLSGERLQHRLQGDLARRGGFLLSGQAGRVTAGPNEALVHLVDGRTLRSALAVDATGAGSQLLERRGSRSPVFQSAFGLEVEVDGHPWSCGEMVLMDYTDNGTDEERTDPTFLYAMPLGARRVFVEETSLARRQPLPFDRLKARLGGRLKRMGLSVRRISRVERCLIPMGVSLPRTDQSLLGFGAAASMVHPATGYHIGSALNMAPQMARAMADGLSCSGPERASRLAWQVLWSPDRIREWELYSFGAEFMAGLDLHTLRSFLASFFQLQPNAWGGFMSGRMTPGDLATAMWTVFGLSEAPLRWRLVRAGLGGSGARLVSKVLSP